VQFLGTDRKRKSNEYATPQSKATQSVKLGRKRRRMNALREKIVTENGRTEEGVSLREKLAG